MAYFCTCKSVDVIMNIDLGVHSRSTAKETAERRSGLHLQPDDDGGAAEPAAEARAPLEFGDVGGQVVDDADEPESEEEGEVGDTRKMVMEKIQDVKCVQRRLAREKETARARRPGRTPTTVTQWRWWPKCMGPCSPMSSNLSPWNLVSV